MPNWEDIRCLLVIAEQGSLTAAAKALRVHHATIGRRIARLEDVLGLPLIERLPHSTRLTSAGHALTELADPMQAAADAVARYGRGVKALGGTVSISVLPALGSAVVAQGLGALRSRYPNLHIVLKADLDPASLERGQVDIAIGLVRPRLPGRIVRRVGCIRYRLYAGQGFTIGDADAWTFVGYEASLAHIAQQRWLKRFAAGRAQVFSSNDVMAQLVAVRGGLGVAALPVFLADGSEGVERVAADAGELRRDLWMSVHSDVRRSPAVRTAMDHLGALLARL